MVKKGDTLIEIVLAVGIFSLVAVAIVSVMSGGTSSAQSALEITLAREEIDTQAEALRFVQSAYIADKDSANSYFSDLWRLIKENAVTINLDDEQSYRTLLDFAPEYCEDLYKPTDRNNREPEVVKYNAFVLNPRKMSKAPSTKEEKGDNESGYVSIKDANAGTFDETITYPRILYGTGLDSNSTNQGDLIESDANTGEQPVWKAEGIYVIAVADASGTTIVGKGTEKETKETAFYDFYIRSCWYGTDADRSSTISTVIRLYNPDALDTNSANSPSQ